MERRTVLLFAATLLLPMLLAVPMAPQFRLGTGPALLVATQNYFLITVPVCALAGYFGARTWNGRALFFGISLLITNLIGMRLFRFLAFWMQ